MSEYNREAFIRYALEASKRVHDAGYIIINGAAPWGGDMPSMDVPPTEPNRIIHSYRTYPDDLDLSTFKLDPLLSINIYTATDFLDRRRIKRNNNKTRKAEQNARKKAHKE